MERKFGRYAIKNLSLVIICAYVLGFILQAVAQNALGLLTLNPYLILHGQVWRLISWLLVPPYTFDIFTIINLFFFFSVGQVLERMWGAFTYNLYIFTGLIFIVAGSFILYFVGARTGLLRASFYGAEGFSYILSMYVSTYYINITVLLAFAIAIPDMEIRLWFFIPLKMKWLAVLEGALLLFDFVRMSGIGRCVMIISLLNFLLLLAGSLIKNGKNTGRKRVFFTAARGNRDNFTVYRAGASADAYKKVSNAPSRHKCCICGQTENDAPALIFRYCSKCMGNYEYCENHLYTHEHIK